MTEDHAGGRDVKVAYPLYQEEDGGANPTRPLHARVLRFETCTQAHAMECNAAWHSRLPVTQEGFFQYAFLAQYSAVTWAVALWGNPTVRMLPPHWLELRRLAICDGAPKNTASRFLGWMVRYFQQYCPERERCISYQDTAVHTGTIYRAAGWTDAKIESRQRGVAERLSRKKKNGSLYRPCCNGLDVDLALKVRWEKVL